MENPLGSDYVQAVAKWAELTASPPPVRGTFVDVWQAYRKAVLPTKAPRTQRDNLKEAENLLRFFGDPPAPLDQITPQHVRQYLRWRVQDARQAAEATNRKRREEGKKPLPIPPAIGQVRANREKALFSHIWNFARAEGYTREVNPCAGVSGYREKGRDVYVSDALLRRLLDVACLPLQYAVRLAFLTGQRPSDVLRMSEAQIMDARLHIQQGKTGARLRIRIEGELAEVIAACRAHKAATRSTSQALLVDERGQRMTIHMLRGRFDKARAAAGIAKAEFQFRDLRAKAATDTDEATDVHTAQALLGHATPNMTASYIRHKAGKIVSPTRRKL